MRDNVNHPAHYTSHPAGIECIQVVEHFGFCLGNAIKYLWRAGLKGDELEDLRKAEWYVAREIGRRLKAIRSQDRASARGRSRRRRIARQVAPPQARQGSRVK